MKTKLTGHHPYISPTISEPDDSSPPTALYWVALALSNDESVVDVHPVMLTIGQESAELKQQFHTNAIIDYWKV